MIEYGWTIGGRMARKAAAPGGGKKRRRRKMRLTLKSKGMKKESGYSDNVGWSKVSGGAPQEEKIESSTIRHQCSMCGSINEVPRPKRQKYSVECAYPDCGHVDEVGEL
jgi:hypothetical protein